MKDDNPKPVEIPYHECRGRAEFMRWAKEFVQTNDEEEVERVDRMGVRIKEFYCQTICPIGKFYRRYARFYEGTPAPSRIEDMARMGLAGVMGTFEATIRSVGD